MIPFITYLSMVKPSNARKLNPQSLSGLFNRYPILLDKVKSDADAEREWRDHVNFPNSYFDVSEDHEFESMDVEFYWNRVFSAKCPSGFGLRFPKMLQKYGRYKTPKEKFNERRNCRRSHKKENNG